MSPRLVCLAALMAAGATGCSKTAPVGGLILIMKDDLTVMPAPDKLHVQLAALDGGLTYRDADYALSTADSSAPGTTPFPTRLVIESNGDSTASVAIEVSIWSGALPLDVRDYRALDIPTDHFDERDIIFSGSCARWVTVDDAGAAVSTCTSGTTCDPGTGECGTDVLGSDAGTPLTDTGDGAVDEGEAGDAGVPEASLPEAGLDGNADTSAEPSGRCVPNTTQCLDYDTPQRCTPDGLWQSEATCSSQGPLYCFKGSCAPIPPSCQGDPTDYFCWNVEVPGGSFFRSDDSLHADTTAPATVSGFRLDALEVDLGRFRKFVTAMTVGGWLPQPGSGKHTHVNGGQGLSSGGSGAQISESGWDPSWTSALPTTLSAWTADFGMCFASPWTPNVDANEHYPINCVTWSEAYAFCIWDGGFLPTEAEWNFAAAGGTLQRLYPWGDADPGPGASYAVYGCYFPGTGPCTSTEAMAHVGSVAAGQGFFGQLDLAGNVAEWTLDVYAPYVTPCVDCVASAGGTQRVFRGGSFDRDKALLYTSARVYGDPSGRFSDVGFRCARAP